MLSKNTLAYILTHNVVYIFLFTFENGVLWRKSLTPNKFYFAI